MEETTDDSEYAILVNREEQYSLWPAFKAEPDGWTRVGPTADKSTCLAWIDEHWTDVRPKSIRPS